MPDTPLNALCGLYLLRFKITLNNIEILYKALNIIIVPTVQFISPWTSETINNNRPGYITLESATFLTQQSKYKYPYWFSYLTLLRGSQRSAGFLSLGSSLSCCCPRWWWLGLFCFPYATYLWWQHDAPSHGALCFLAQSEPLWSACVECFHFWKVFSNSALFIASATQCQLQSSILSLPHLVYSL